LIEKILEKHIELQALDFINYVKKENYIEDEIKASEVGKKNDARENN
jgi:hypothetical protein